MRFGGANNEQWRMAARGEGRQKAIKKKGRAYRVQISTWFIAYLAWIK
jgi:hypothetical protein